ncbi:DEAD/DEAH box helicase family protein [Acinetobacter sp. Z1]|uniref:DEAD/DEAH box helicase n=1 Tax=Acinetobacter sp. Z1 TaxID=2953738 RepID=UPI0020C880D9|nr:DEAD/DEAH box helicase family protein [Acinetobacter sp. Z1]UTO18345.1 DEAD/DEAH box helicase family protein [Acinetobacter sp. Z1]
MPNLVNMMEFNLSEGQMIADHLASIEVGTTLLKASTGTGKSTFVVETLMPQERVVMLCPKVSQVQQLEQNYKDQGTVFCYGELKVSEEELSTNNIVATYDQLAKIKPYIQSDTILVVDEVHQLYCAGGYRGKALNEILDFMQKKHVRKVLLVSATLTMELLDKLPLSLDHIYQFTQVKPVQRQIFLQQYAQQHDLNCVNFIINRVNLMKSTDSEKIIFVRINDKRKAEEYRFFLQKQGISTLVVNRERQGNEAIIDMVNSSKLSMEYSVILTTSVWDEAINFMNTDDEIDSIHILGGNTHVDEITQFIGRTRHANPPIYIHLDQEIDSSIINDVVAIHHQYVEIVDLECAANIKILEHLQAASQLMKQKQSLKGYKVVETINKALKDLIKIEGLGSIDDEITINHAVVAAKAFSIDTQNLYSNIGYLEYRLTEANPNAFISQTVSTATIGGELEKAYAEAKQKLQELKENKVSGVAKQYLKDTRQVYGVTSHGKQILKNPQVIPYIKEDSEIEFDLYYHMAEVSIYVGNMHDILEILRRDSYKSVKKVGHEYQNHPIIKILMDQIAKHIFINDQASKTYDVKALEKLINQGLRKLDKDEATKFALGIKSHKYFELDQRNKIVLKSNQAVNFVKKYCNVRVKNDKKSYEDKIVTFMGLGWGGYQYNGLSYIEPNKPQCIELEGERIDARSGQLLSDISELTQTVAA